MLIWSGAFVAFRASLPDVTPFYFLALRFTIAGGLLALALPFLVRDWRPGAAGLFHLALSGALINACYLGAAYQAMTEIRGATMALIGALHPLATALLSGPLLGERFRRRQWAGFLLGAAGVAAVAGVGAFDLGRPRGVALALASVAALTLGTLYHARFCRSAPLLGANAVQLSAAAAVAWLFAWTLETPRADWTPGMIGALAYLTFGVSLGAMALLLFMLRQGEAGRAASNFYLVPAVTALLAWALLGETLPAAMWPGFALATLGVWLIRRRA